MPQVVTGDPTVQLLVEEEKEVLHAYPDSLGYQTLGVGRLVDQRRGGGISQTESRYLLGNDITKVRAYCITHIPGYSHLNAIQRAAIESMVFQLGDGGVDGFTSFKRLLQTGDVQGAASAALESEWAEKQSPTRAQREMKMLSTGVWVPHS